MASLTITFEPTSPMQAQVVARVFSDYLNAGDQGGGAPAAVAVEAPAPAEIAAPKRTRAAKATGTPAQIPTDVKPEAESVEQTPAPAAAAVTLEQVRAKLSELTQKGKGDQVKALLKTYGATRLTDVAEENYAVLMDDAERI
jgi:hypothetical protein